MVARCCGWDDRLMRIACKITPMLCHDQGHSEITQETTQASAKSTLFTSYPRCPTSLLLSLSPSLSRSLSLLLVQAPLVFNRYRDTLHSHRSSTPTCEAFPEPNAPRSNSTSSELTTFQRRPHPLKMDQQLWLLQDIGN